MSRRLFVRLHDSLSQLSWQYVENGQLSGAVRHGEIDELAREAHAPVVVLVPAEQVFLAQVALPGRNRQRLLNAVPYAVEDQLVDDIDELHFALSEQTASGRYWVAAVNKLQMQQWFDLFDSAGLKMESMLPDALSLNADAEQATVVVEGDRAVVRFPNSAFACELHNLPLLLKNGFRSMPSGQARRVELFDCGQTDVLEFLRQGLEDTEFDQRDCTQGLLEVAAGQWQAREGISLLHGPYSRREKLGQHLRPWLIPAVAFGLWVVLVLGLQIYQYIELNQRSTQLHEQMVSVYKRAFPSADKVPPPGYVRQQMEQRIAQLQRDRGESATSFQAMVARTAPVLSEMTGVTVNALRYYEGQLDVELDLKQADQLQALSDRLSEKTGWQVEVQSAATRDELTQVRLQIKAGNG